MKSMADRGKRYMALLVAAALLAGCSSTASRAGAPTVPGSRPPAARPPSSAAVTSSPPLTSLTSPTSSMSATPTGDPNFPGDTTSPWWGRPIFADDFNGDRLDPAAWQVYDSPDAQVNPRTSAATTVSGGQLHLTGGIYHGRDLSGGVGSRLLQRYGRWEVRLRADRGRGYSAVALLWPEHMGVPEFAEIDFAEMIDHTRQTAGIFIHHGPADDQAGSQMTVDFTQWHVVALDWLRDHMTFWLDGKPVWTYRGPLIPRLDRMGLALQNDQVCDRGPGFCRDHTTPPWVHMDVDWVQVYRAP